MRRQFLKAMLRKQYSEVCRFRDCEHFVTRYRARVTFQSLTGRVRYLKMVAHSAILLSKCAQFREEGQFIDVRLKVREDIFPVHRIVLAANSVYFYAMFTDGMKESNQAVVELKDEIESISPDAFKIVMDAIYTGDLRVSEENVFQVLTAADHLKVTTVVQQCCDFLKKEFI